MSSLSDNDRFAPPRAHVEDVSTGAAALAGRGARLGAALLDALVIAVVAAVLFLVLAMIGLIDWRSFSNGIGAPGLVANTAIGIGLFALINGNLLAKRGQTVGKAALGLRIVRSSGEPASFGRLLGLRYGIGWVVGSIPIVGTIYSLVDGLFIFRESRRCVHDLIADTIVIKA